MSDEFFSWDDVRAELLEPEDESEVLRLRDVLQEEIRAWRFAEAREHGLLNQE